MIGRRKFLKVLGIGTASAPIAAKVAAEQEVAKLTGLRGYNVPPLSYGKPASFDGIALKSAAHPEPDGTLIHDYMLRFGRVPAHVEHAIRESQRCVYHLDDDIAVKKSWSHSVKIMTQRQRNVENEIARQTADHSWQNRARKQFFEKFGFWW